MKIVLDTNCLIQSIPEKSPYHGVWLSFEKGDNTRYIVSNDKHYNILKQIPYPNIDVISIAKFMETLTN